MKQETFDKQARIAMHAITGHMIDHDLPVPMEIEPRPDEQIIRIYLRGLATHDEWLNSVDVDRENNEYRTPRPGELEPFFRTTWTVRLPDLGVRLELVGSRPLPFSVVSA